MLSKTVPFLVVCLSFKVDWVIEATDTDGTGRLTRAETRSSVALWYFHMAASPIDPRRGCRAEVPWCYSSAAGVACALMVSKALSSLVLPPTRIVLSKTVPFLVVPQVAWYSVNWSEEKTIAWLEASGLSLIWKLVSCKALPFCCASTVFLSKTVAFLVVPQQQFVFDPLKSLCCGPILEPIATVLCGGGAGYVALNTILEDLDGRIEESEY
eukprot:SAG22_NODE_178_length_16142_cov_13.187995_16_plen_212_part_00